MLYDVYEVGAPLTTLPLGMCKCGVCCLCFCAFVHLLGSIVCVCVVNGVRGAKSVTMVTKCAVLVMCVCVYVSVNH